MKLLRFGCFVVGIWSASLTTAEAFSTNTAKATVTVDGNTFTFGGGSCLQNGAGLVVNFGVPAGPGSKARSDYFGASIEKVPGHFTNGVVSFIKEGKRYSISIASGDATASGATFYGTLMRGGTAKGSFSC